MSKRPPRNQNMNPELARAQAMAARLDAARAEPDAAMREILEDSPPESGPPTDAELGQLGQEEKDAERGRRGDAETGDVAETATAVQSPRPRVPVSPRPSIRLPALDPTTKAAGDAMAGQLAAAWPTGPLVVDWPWGVEPDPQVGEFVGWNWQRSEVAVVTRQPEIQGTEPWRITVEPREMPAESRGPAKLVNLYTGKEHKHAAWFTRWNRAGEECVTGAKGEIVMNADGSGPQTRKFGGWMSVVKLKVE